MRLASCHAGDIGDVRVVTLGGVADLSAASSVEAHVRRNSVTVVLAAAVTDAANNEVTIQLGTAPTDWLPSHPALGVWYGQIEVTFADGSKITWPTGDGNRGMFTINVYAEIA